MVLRNYFGMSIVPTEAYAHSEEPSYHDQLLRAYPDRSRLLSQYALNILIPYTFGLKSGMKKIIIVFLLPYLSFNPTPLVQFA